MINDNLFSLNVIRIYNSITNSPKNNNELSFKRCNKLDEIRGALLTRAPPTPTHILLTTYRHTQISFITCRQADRLTDRQRLNQIKEEGKKFHRIT